MLWPYCIGLVAVAFIVLVIFSIRTLIELRLAIRQSRDMVTRMESRLDQTTGETLVLVRSSQRIAADIERLLKAADGFIETMGTTGEAASRLSQSVNGISRSLKETILGAQNTLHNQQDTVRDMISLATTGVQLWQRWQSRKPSKATSKTDEHHEGDDQ